MVLNIFQSTFVWQSIKQAQYRQLDEKLTKLINVQTVLIDAQAKQLAFFQALAEHYGDSNPALHQALQSLEGDSEVTKQQQADLIAAYELNRKRK